ncbi:MAG: tetratricopeptide repeat-containing sensor histidine kinase [Mucilaginibacter sp.]|nr:tetratricopeptide repeat-containing sensor histidine kinase [Mucilaginibacter sp.]
MPVSRIKHFGIILLLTFCAGPTFAQLLGVKKDYNEGNYVSSLNGALQAYRQAQQTHDQAALADAGNLIGLIRLAQGQPDVAIQFFRHAASINKRINNQQRLAANYINLSLGFSDLHHTDSTIRYLKSALDLSTRIKAANLIAMATNHLGDAYYKKAELQLAERKYLAVIHNKNYQSNWENSFAYSGLARIRLEQHQYPQAARFADIAFQYALRSDVKWDAAQALAVGHIAYWKQGDAKTAYRRLLNYKLYSDSVLNLEKDKALNSLFLKDKSFENERLSQQVNIGLQQRKIDRLFIVVVSLLALVIVFAAFLIYRQNERTRKENQTKDRIFSIISHDLRSPLAGLEATLQLFKSGDISSDELIILADQMSGQLAGTSSMLDSLLLWAGNQLGGITTKPVQLDLPKKIEKVSATLFIVAKRKQIEIIHEPQSLPPFTGDADQVRIVLQNLIANAIKYTNAKGRVRIFYRLDSRLHLFIQDNGVGMSQHTLNHILTTNGFHAASYGTANEKGIGLGMQLVKIFAQQNGIELRAESEIGKGTTFELIFNLEHP